ncbi:MAG TPA: hypothetical protein VFW23_18990 [Tepidisphaeraceae bacterium]|nr:hypothetical protein [Tepidisphaeraceae bacterium]
MPLLPESQLPPILVAKPEALEVLETFEHLYERVDRTVLPPRARVMPYTDDAEMVNLRDNTPPWQETGLPPKRDFSYSEIFDSERGKYKRILSLDDRRPITAFISRGEIIGHIERIAPARLRSYSDWIDTDLGDILTKRAAVGRAPSLLEDLFQVYRAGYFSYGWAGEYPDDVHFLVFPARD